MIMSLTLLQKKRRTMENLNDRPAQASYQETLMYLMNLINDINNLNVKDFISGVKI